MTVEYLSVDDVLRIARRAVGEEVVVRNRFVLESAIGQPTMTMFGEDLYPDLAAKAAALWYSIDHNQPLLDGNKRTAVLATATFVRANDHRLMLSDDEMYDLAMRVATGDVKDTEALAAVLRPLIVPG